MCLSQDAVGFSPPLVKFDNAAILAVKTTIHTNPSRKRSFSKLLFKSEEFENAFLSLPCPRFPQTQIPNNTTIVAFFNVDGKYLLHFKSATSVFKVLQRGQRGQGVKFAPEWFKINHNVCLVRALAHFFYA